MAEVILYLRELYCLLLHKWVQALNSFQWMNERVWGPFCEHTLWGIIMLYSPDFFLLVYLDVIF